jgi:hypothetical protein
VARYRNLNFSLNGEKLEIVNSLNYLGIELSRTGNFKRTKQSIAGKIYDGVDDFR